MKAKPIGIYIHVPFCLKKCNYCDFCSVTYKNEDFKTRYINSLCDEISLYKGRGINVDTVFFGGGTPTLLSGDEFTKIITAITDSFSVLPNAEITMEANPKTVTEENLCRYIASGVDRISIGLQTVHENELKILGRIHSFEDFLSTYRLCRSMGISNINVDLMYGIPEQTADSFDKTLQQVIALRPEHISLYGLILEEGTPLFECRKSLILPDEDAEKAMYLSAVSTLKEAGYVHYEISNYAVSGKKCAHNLKYWRDEEYLGFGVAAYSYFEGVRFGNTCSLEDYIKGELRLGSKEIISKEDETFEYAMLRLRLTEGICDADYTERFGKSFFDGRKDKIDRYINIGLIRYEDGRIFFTDDGFYLSNAILSDIL